MPKYPIDLGKKMDSTMPKSVSSKKNKNEKYYPSLYLDWDDKYDLPDSGTMTVKFRKTSETNTTRSGEKSRQSVSLDILEITDTKAEKVSDKESKEESGEEALDRHMDEAKKKESDEDDY